MQTSQELRSLGKITYPTIFTGALLFSKSIISVLFLSHLGFLELAGGSFAISFANISGHSIMKGLSMAMEPICCQAYGAKRWSILTQTHNKTVILLLIAAIPIIALWLAMEPILLWSGQDREFTEIVEEYITYAIFELLAQAYLNVLKNFIRSQSITTPIYVSAIIAIILHGPINYLLTITLKLGVKGVALSTGLCSLNMIIGILVYLYKSDSTLKPWDRTTGTGSSHGWKPLLGSALPSTFSVSLEWWWYEIMLLICSRLNNPQANIATMGIVMQLTGLLYVIPHSLSLGMSTCIGNELGADQPAKAKKIAVIGIAAAFGLGIMASVVTFVLKEKLGKLYTKEQEILKMISEVLPLLGLCEIGNFPQTTATGILRGSARQDVVAYIHFSSFYVIGLPIALVASFVFKMGFIGPWIGHAAAQVSCVVIMLYILVRTNWEDQARKAKELTRETASEVNDAEVNLLEDDPT
ncbi:hypothetical protein RND81_10G089300 [Saponaria officinalis]|uniref:Protein DETOXIFICATION n=1 Tax=Saponaria officinalis TaxID=3572 RepID=A0AAW1I036_SAPOF